MNPWTRRAVLLMLLGLLMVAAAIGAAITWLVQRYQHGLDQLEPRIERLAGLVAAAPEVQSKLQQASEQTGPWLHPAGASAQTDVQQRLRQLIDAAGLTTVALQAGEPERDPVAPLARIRLTATLTGSWPAAVNFLRTLETQRPAFWVQSVGLQREGRDSPTEPQTVRLVVHIEAPTDVEPAP
jgi:general secretion pathway protein M